MSLLLFSVATGAAIGGLVLFKAAEIRRLRAELVAYELRFPRQLEPTAVTAFLGGLSGLLLPWWRRWFSQPFAQCWKWWQEREASSIACWWRGRGRRPSRT